jgi:membrane associated rhomboid family serine protease
VGTLVLLLIVLYLAYRGTTAEDRARLVRTVVDAILRAKNAPSQPNPFRDALQERTPRLIVMPALVALNVAIFVFMLFGAGALGDPATLVSWGGSVGPRTTNLEWWRLVTAMFVHSGMLHLLVNVAVLVQLGLILERLVGPLAFASVYVAAGVFGGLVSLSAYPVSVTVGASGAIFGLYGLLLASSIWGVIHPSSMTIPLRTLKRLGPAAGLFVLYNLAIGGLEPAAGGIVVGFLCGLVLAIGVGDGKPEPRRIGITMGVTALIAVAAAIPLRRITDVRPEIARVVALEDRTASAYSTAADRFNKGRITAEALAQLIDRTIVPEVEAAQAHLRTLDRVPQEHQALVADAEEFLRLRHESWRLRAEGLRKTSRLVMQPGRTGTSDASSRLRAEAQFRANMIALGNAEGAERASLEAFQKIRPDPKVADQK